MTQLRVGETHTPSEEGEGRADFLGLSPFTSQDFAAFDNVMRGTAVFTSCRLLSFGPAPQGRAV
jgi:hypothetical protein